MAELIRAGKKDFPQSGAVPFSDQSRTYLIAIFSFQKVFS